MYSVVVAEEDAEQRIDKYLADYFVEFTRSYIQKLIKTDHIIVNGKPSIPESPAGVRFMAFDSSGDRLFVAINEQREKTAKCTLPLDDVFYRLPDGRAFEECDYELRPYEVLLLSSRPIVVWYCCIYYIYMHVHFSVF